VIEVRKCFFWRSIVNKKNSWKRIEKTFLEIKLKVILHRFLTRNFPELDIGLFLFLLQTLLSFSLSTGSYQIVVIHRFLYLSVLLEFFLNGVRTPVWIFYNQSVWETLFQERFRYKTDLKKCFSLLNDLPRPKSWQNSTFPKSFHLPT